MIETEAFRISRFFMKPIVALGGAERKESRTYRKCAILERISAYLTGGPIVA